MPKLFVTPNAHELQRSNDSFWKRFRRGYVGATVLKSVTGTYRIVETPSADEIAASAVAYQGGHEYIVSDEEAQSLVSAGFTVTEI